jgi:hypothetical protein
MLVYQRVYQCISYIWIGLMVVDLPRLASLGRVVGVSKPQIQGYHWGDTQTFGSPLNLLIDPYLVANYPLSKWVITPVINGISRVNPLIIGVIAHLQSGMSHQILYKFISGLL